MIGTERGTVGGGGCTSNCENTCVLIPFPHQLLLSLISSIWIVKYQSQSHLYSLKSQTTLLTVQYSHTNVCVTLCVWRIRMHKNYCTVVSTALSLESFSNEKCWPEKRHDFSAFLQKCDSTVLILWRRRLVTCYEQCLHYFPLQNRIRRKIWIPLHYRLNRRSGLLLTKCVLLLQPLKWRTR